MQRSLCTLITLFMATACGAANRQPNSSASAAAAIASTAPGTANGQVVGQAVQSYEGLVINPTNPSAVLYISDRTQSCDGDAVIPGQFLTRMVFFTGGGVGADPGPPSPGVYQVNSLGDKALGANERRAAVVDVSYDAQCAKATASGNAGTVTLTKVDDAGIQGNFDFTLGNGTHRVGNIRLTVCDSSPYHVPGDMPLGGFGALDATCNVSP